jgi:hypothetical protein
VSSHSANRYSSRVAAVAAPAVGPAPSAATAKLPGRYADGNGDDLITTPVRNSPATASDPDDVTGSAPIVSGAYIYGYDSAGNPTLTDAGCYRPSHSELPD